MLKSGKTILLLGGLTGLLLFIGELVGGSNGVVVAFGFAIAMNGISYFFSHKIAVKMARAVPMDEAEYPGVYAIVRSLSQRAGEPMPALYISPSPQLNAFATGRNPQHAVVCVNHGLYEALTDEELEGVLGHELQHVYNRDILVGSVAATIAGAIMMVSRMALWFGGGRRRDSNPVIAIAMLILGPIAAIMVQAAITRSRESLADHTGAELTGNPLGLARALAKLEAGANDPRRLKAGGVPAEMNQAYAHLYIAAPFGGRLGLGRLFSTHPPIPDRIAALEEMAREKGQLGPGQTIYG
jgi:heat shock protein HtpX